MGLKSEILSVLQEGKLIDRRGSESIQPIQSLKTDALVTTAIKP